MSFVSESILESLGTLTESEADKEPYSIVKLSDDGIVELYNAYQAELGKMEKEDAVGKNFFLHALPCSNSRLFRGEFEKGIDSGELDHSFSYTLTYRIRPTNVSIRLYRCPDSKTNWVFIQKK